MCACVDAVLVQCDDALYSPSTLLTHAHTPPQEDKCHLPQPKLVPTEGGEGEGEGEEPLLNKIANQWMSTRDLMKMCVCVCVCVCMCVRACDVQCVYMCLCEVCVMSPHPWGVSVM